MVAADRAAALTKRLLVFSRTQAVEVKLVDINELILGLQKMLVRIVRESIEIKLALYRILNSYRFARPKKV